MLKMQWHLNNETQLTNIQQSIFMNTKMFLLLLSSYVTYFSSPFLFFFIIPTNNNDKIIAHPFVSLKHKHRKTVQCCFLFCYIEMKTKDFDWSTVKVLNEEWKNVTFDCRDEDDEARERLQPNNELLFFCLESHWYGIWLVFILIFTQHFRSFELCNTTIKIMLNNFLWFV